MLSRSGVHGLPLVAGVLDQAVHEDFPRVAVDLRPGVLSHLSARALRESAELPGADRALIW
jgi:hypothetical protein